MSSFLHYLFGSVALALGLILDSVWGTDLGNLFTLIFPIIYWLVLGLVWVRVEDDRKQSDEVVGLTLFLQYTFIVFGLTSAFSLLELGDSPTYLWVIGLTLMALSIRASVWSAKEALLGSQALVVVGALILGAWIWRVTFYELVIDQTAGLILWVSIFGLGGYSLYLLYVCNCRVLAVYAFIFFFLLMMFEATAYLQGYIAGEVACVFYALFYILRVSHPSRFTKALWGPEMISSGIVLVLLLYNFLPLQEDHLTHMAFTLMAIYLPVRVIIELFWKYRRVFAK
ncbi:MAG: hypothetical protein S4CHLAM102_16460 [Chlamydiia bacterium]|nr:hypothetical protein [Chlamydiia bacterium]